MTRKYQALFAVLVLAMAALLTFFVDVVVPMWRTALGHGA